MKGAMISILSAIGVVLWTLIFFVAVVPVRCIIMLAWLVSEFVCGGIERIAERLESLGLNDSQWDWP
jgi:hypothetical protein